MNHAADSASNAEKSTPLESAPFDYDSKAVASILGTSLDAVFTIDDHGTIVDLNLAATRLFGWSREELLGANIKTIVPSPLKEKHDGFLKAFNPERGVKHVLGAGQRLDGERKDGSHFPVEVGISPFMREGRRYFTGFVRDMTERQRTEDQMRYLATHDTKSGLLNYRGLADHGNASSDGEARIVVFRLEEYRRFAVIYGEPWCDGLLHELGTRLQSFMHPREAAARIREDTFALQVTADAAGRAEALVEVLKHPFTQGTMSFPLTATLGVSLPRGALDLRLRSAQWACEHAGMFGKGRINEFTNDLYISSRREMQIESLLPDVVSQGRLSLALQPKIRLVDRRIAGAEALVRWTGPATRAGSPKRIHPHRRAAGPHWRHHRMDTAPIARRNRPVRRPLHFGRRQFFRAGFLPAEPRTASQHRAIASPGRTGAAGHRTDRIGRGARCGAGHLAHARAQGPGRSHFPG